MKTKHKVILGVSIGVLALVGTGTGVYYYTINHVSYDDLLGDPSCSASLLVFEGHHYSAYVNNEQVPLKAYGEQIGYAINSKDEKKFVKKNPGVRYGITDSCTYKVPKKLYSVVGDDELRYLRIQDSWVSLTLERID